MIEVTGVNKMFGEIKALDNIVATIQEGSIFGLIGQMEPVRAHFCV